MEIYLVGGAVRDKLLGLPIKEKDWVVVGATPEEMLALGYRQVGKDFPVFLHPETHEEYALARTERKVSRGYTGFSFNASAAVTLEEDLLRRDLTINAIAEKTDGKLVDPYRGEEDLEKRLLRHVSPAFIEDPVRILRVGRFAARFAELGFDVASETTLLMQEMVKLGEVNALVPERVWKELERALQEKTPTAFFEVLIDCHAQPILFPALKEENLKALTAAAKLTSQSEIRFAALLCGLSSEEINTLCERYRVPTAYRELALLVSNYYPAYLEVLQQSPEELLSLLQATDAFRRESRFQQFLEGAKAVAYSKNQSDNTEYLWQMYLAAKQIDIQQLTKAGYSGPELGKEITRQRLEKIRQHSNR